MSLNGQWGQVVYEWWFISDNAGLFLGSRSLKDGGCFGKQLIPYNNEL